METLNFPTRGATTPLWSFRSEAEVRAQLQDLKASGATSTIIDFQLTSPTLSASQVSWVEDVQKLGDAIRIASEIGLDVWLKPIVMIGENGLNWQKLNPSDKASWFNAYEKCLLEALATDTRGAVSHLLVTNELTALTTDPTNEPYWSGLISSLRAHHPLQIGFNAGGLLGEPAGRAEFERIPDNTYQLVDFVGISAYPRVDGVNLTDFKASWADDSHGNDLISIMHSFFEKTSKPIYFTELGSAAVPGGNKAFYEQGVFKPDFAHPSLFYKAASEILSKEFSGELKGLFVYAWSLTKEVQQNPGAEAWIVNHSSVQDVIRDWFKNGVSVDNRNIGTDLADKIYGTSVGDIIIPGHGADTVYAYGGNDTIQITTTSAPASLQHSLKITASSDILDGVAALLEVRMNGVPIGQIQLAPVIAGVDSASGNLPFSTTQTFEFGVLPVSPDRSARLI